MKRVVIFCFAGREENMELQLPFIERILDAHPGVEYHCWDLSLTEEDHQYLATLKKRHKRIRVYDQFYGDDPWNHFDDVYRYYTQKRFAGTTFVKIDEDVVFLESGRFADFIEAIESSPHAVVSAKVFNNGACTATEPGLWRKFRANHMLARSPLDVHKKPQYATLCHDYFCHNWPAVINQRVELMATQDWLSINLVGFDYPMMLRIAALLKTPHPRMVAGRLFRPTDKLGDEGTFNTLPRLILHGFSAVHLYFGPQRKLLNEATVNEWRSRYRKLGKEYLS
jgi:hypothetical protein